jgi:hypothetical protein
MTAGDLVERIATVLLAGGDGATGCILTGWVCTGRSAWYCGCGGKGADWI